VYVAVHTPNWLMRTVCTPLLFSLVLMAPAARGGTNDAPGSASVAVIDPAQDFGSWQGWGSSLAWWGRAIGGTNNADFYADLIYTTKIVNGYPGLGLNIVRYNVGGGGIHQSSENKGPKLQWQMDIHGYWVNSNSDDPGSANWDWSVDANQRAILEKAKARGADMFEMFSDSPMWWMNSNHSTAGSDTGGDCLEPANYRNFTHYLATVARQAKDHWGIHFASIEPFNEPSADWWTYPGRQEGCHFDVATQQKIIALLRGELEKAGLGETAVAAADENDVDVGLKTWESYGAETRAVVTKINVHGYHKGTNSYRGPNMPALRRVAGSKILWQSEYGDGDGSGYTMARSIIREIRGLNPTAWLYWQPVEPAGKDDGWGLVNANYVDTGDHERPDVSTPFVRANRKFFVYGQLTRYLRPGFHIIGNTDPGSIAGFDVSSKTLVIITVTGDSSTSREYDLSKFRSLGDTVRQVVTTTAPGKSVPDWKQQVEDLPIQAGRRAFATSLYPESVYTFVMKDVLP
jgi:galactan endo-1,6-beta-galactosidase